MLDDGEYRLLVHPSRTPYSPVPHKSLALLLATSGSTGNAKLVRLSRRNLIANARSIAAYLQLGPGERAIQSLPMHYAYGLSLMDIEEEIERHFPCRVIAMNAEDEITLLVESCIPLERDDVRLHAARFLSVRPHVIRVDFIEQLPITASGKKDYQAIVSQARSEYGVRS